MFCFAPNLRLYPLQNQLCLPFPPSGEQRPGFTCICLPDLSFHIVLSFFTDLSFHAGLSFHADQSLLLIFPSVPTCPSVPIIYFRAFTADVSRLYAERTGRTADPEADFGGLSGFAAGIFGGIYKLLKLFSDRACPYSVFSVFSGVFLSGLKIVSIKSRYPLYTLSKFSLVKILTFRAFLCCIDPTFVYNKGA